MAEEKGKALEKSQQPQTRASEVQEELAEHTLDKVTGGASLGDISIGKTTDGSSPK